MKISEKTLRKIISESVKMALNEKIGDIDSFGDSFEDAVTVAANGDSEDWNKYVSRGKENPNQDIINKLIPIYRQLESTNQIEASNHVLKAMDLLKYPNIKRN